VEWLVGSLILSAVLTVVLNAFMHAFPRTSRRAARRLDDLMTPRADDGRDDDGRDDEPSVRVFFPWRTMIVVSVILTVATNLVIRLL
jgi:hypothetical protein